MKRNAAKSAERRSAQPIQTADLDDEIVKAIEETVRHVLIYSTRPAHLVKDKTETEAEKEWAENRWVAAHKSLYETMQLPGWWKAAGHLIGWVVGLSTLALFAAFLFALATERGWFIVLYPLTGLVLGIVSTVWNEKQQAKRKRARTFVPDVLTQVLPLVEHKSTMEAAYSAAIAALMPHATVWGHAALQTHLRDLNDLLIQGRDATSRRAEIEQAVSRQSVQDADSEAEKMVERLEQIHDAEARAVFTQSLAHLEGRKNRLQNMEPLRERLEARETAIVEALREAQVTLADAHFMGVKSIAPAETADFTSAASPAPWTNTVSRIRWQTVSVESALQEVAGAVRAASV